MLNPWKNALKRNVGCRGGGGGGGDTKIACFSLSFTNMEFNWHFRWGGEELYKRDWEIRYRLFTAYGQEGKILVELGRRKWKEQEFNFPRLFWQYNSMEIKEPHIPFFSHVGGGIGKKQASVVSHVGNMNSDSFFLRPLPRSFKQTPTHNRLPRNANGNCWKILGWERWACMSHSELFLTHSPHREKRANWKMESSYTRKEKNDGSTESSLINGTAWVRCRNLPNFSYFPYDKNVLPQDMIFPFWKWANPQARWKFHLLLLWPPFRPIQQHQTLHGGGRRRRFYLHTTPAMKRRRRRRMEFHSWPPTWWCPLPPCRK